MCVVLGVDSKVPEPLPTSASWSSDGLRGGAMAPHGMPRQTCREPRPAPPPPAGGKVGFDKRRFSVESQVPGKSVDLKYISPEGEEVRAFPGGGGRMFGQARRALEAGARS